MTQPATAVRIGVLHNEAPRVDRGNGNAVPKESATARGGEIKLAIHVPLDKVSVQGWTVSDAHLILFAKTK